MISSRHLEREQKAPLGSFLLYFPHLGSIGFGGFITLFLLRYVDDDD